MYYASVVYCMDDEDQGEYLNEYPKSQFSGSTVNINIIEQGQINELV